MKQVYKFNTEPATISNGGYKKGSWIVWLNLNVAEIEEPQENQPERFESVTDRYVLSDKTLSAFLDVVDPAHLAMASNTELEAILRYFQVDEDIDSWKAIRKVQIQGYDSSNKVNQFYLNDVALWLDKATRVGLVNSITIEKEAGREETCLWFDGLMVRMKVTDALAALSQLELYALDCYNVTAQHQVAITQAQAIDELRDFDITADYPEMLQFKM
jgi:hypothetical protein